MRRRTENLLEQKRKDESLDEMYKTFFFVIILMMGYFSMLVVLLMSKGNNI